jgi:predicted transcriptional regulator
MTVPVSGQLESRLRDLARRAGVGVDAIVEEALRQYLDAAAITDVTDSEIADTQEKLAGELNAEVPWEDHGSVN